MFAVKRYARGSTPVARPCHRRHLGRRRTLKVVSPTILVLVEVDGFNLLLILRGPLSAGHCALLLQASILKEPPVSLQAAPVFALVMSAPSYPSYGLTDAAPHEARLV